MKGQSLTPTLRTRFTAVKAVFMDVDGVLTDGSAIFIKGESPKVWHVRDRLGIKALISRGVKVFWISGRPSQELEERARELGVHGAYHGVSDKFTLMKSLLSEAGLGSSEALYIGDDLVDLRCMEYAGVGCAPSDAVREVMDSADFVSDFPGGRGAVRQVAEVLLESLGLWEGVVEEYRTAGELRPRRK